MSDVPSTSEYIRDLTRRLKDAEDALRRVRALAKLCASAREPDGSTAYSPVVWFATALQDALDGTNQAGDGQ